MLAGLLDGGGRFDAIALAQQRQFIQGAQIGLVIDDKDGGSGGVHADKGSDHDGVKQRCGIGRARDAAEPDGEGVSSRLAACDGAIEPLVADGRTMALTQLAANIKPQAAGSAL
ncbi:hypothetical protein D3C87_1753560 [compost metagenome]